MNQRDKIVIIGATSLIAEHCARLWLQATPAVLCLVGRDAARLQRVADDLQVRSPASAISVHVADLIDPAAVRGLVDQLCADEVPAQVLIAHGALPDQAECERDLQAMHDALVINAISPALWAQAFAGHLQRVNRGCLGVIGSVAGDRGRKSNYVYGAAKGLVERCVQGLQHRLAATAVRVVLIKPGPTDTPMTAALKQRGQALAPVAAVAQAIVAGMQRGQPVVYAPGRWRLIMAIIRHLPRFIFHRMDI